MVTVPGLGEVDGRTRLDALECVWCILLPIEVLAACGILAFPLQLRGSLATLECQSLRRRGQLRHQIHPQRA